MPCDRIWTPKQRMPRRPRRNNKGKTTARPLRFRHTRLPALTRTRSKLEPADSAFGEIEGRGALQFRLGHARRAALVPSDGIQDIADIGRVTRAQFRAALAQAQLTQIFGAVGFGLDTPGPHHALENLVERKGVDGLDQNRVVEAAEARLADQLYRCAARREDLHGFKPD